MWPLRGLGVTLGIARAWCACGG